MSVTTNAVRKSLHSDFPEWSQVVLDSAHDGLIWQRKEVQRLRDVFRRQTSKINGQWLDMEYGWLTEIEIEYSEMVNIYGKYKSTDIPRKDNADTGATGQGTFRAVS